MNTSKFFRFTIYGDNLNIKELENNIPLPCHLFFKDDTITKIYDKEYHLKQKTNRWLYINEKIDDSSASSFLTTNLILLNKFVKLIRRYTDKYSSKIELIIYADNKTDICLTKTQIKLLSNLNTKLYISFC